MTQLVWSNLMDSLKSEHKALAELIGNKKVAYVDIPIHFNTGDLLIYKGTEAFFESFNINVIYRAGYKYLNDKKISEADIILFHGGGNFGDLYDLHQNLREGLVKKYHHKMIICLPQSIHFSNDENLAKSAAVFKAHPNFVFCVRDHRSIEIAKKFTDHVLFQPDMAHQLHPLVDKSEVGISNIYPPKILNLIRVDKEQRLNNRIICKKGFDWVNLTKPEDILYFHLYHKMNKVPFLRDKAMNLWSFKADEIIFGAWNYFNNYTVVHTDRLHGFILSSLLGKEICLYDNSYGKNTNYYNAWLKGYPFITVSAHE